MTGQIPVSSSAVTYTGAPSGPEGSGPEVSGPDGSGPEKLGTLKIFFGYAAGVGKTCAMLAAAHTARAAGVDVVAGYVEPHQRPETQAMLEGLETLPTLSISYDSTILHELDLDSALRRKPRLILVDEMAHTNARGCRHAKRYQDIQELLRHGIDVYTTVNVQHVESLHDVVESITGVAVRERVPDKVFDSANHVELVDLEPDELLERLQNGKIYRPGQADRAMRHFFTKENLVALREVALRRTADLVNKTVEKNKSLQQRSDYFTSEHLLVCLSSSPSNARVIRTAARMAEAFHGRLTALFIETSASLDMSRENRNRLDANARLAEDLGARLATVQGDDIPWHVAEFAKAGGISKIVIGRPGITRVWMLRASNFIDELTALAPHLDIYVIPNQLQHPSSPRQPQSFLRFTMPEALRCLVCLVASTALGLVFHSLRFSEANTIMVYMLGALLTAMYTHSLVLSTCYSLGSVLAFNFFFTEPRFSFHAYDPGYPVTFGIMLLASGVISTLAHRLQQQKLLAAHKAHRTSLLLETSQKLQGARNSQEIIEETGRQITRLLSRTVLIYPTYDNGLGEPVMIGPTPSPEAALTYTSRQERAVAEWCLLNRKQAGAGTSTLPGACCLYLCIRGQEEALGVAAVATDSAPLDPFEKGLLVAVLGECSLALEKEHIREGKDQAFQQARQESLRAGMLRAISHDLRTPLTSISGNAHILLAEGATLPEATRQRLYTDMRDDAAWLISLVENILSVTRLEDSGVHLCLEPEMLADCIHEALRHVRHEKTERQLTVQLEDDLLMAYMDPRLFMQVIANLTDNAIKHSPPDSTIVIAAWRRGDQAIVEVRDEGDGIPDEAKPRIFDMFYTAHQSNSDNRRGLGLGLYLCKSIIAAHGGRIHVADNEPTGTVFSFTLRAVELEHA